jgi:hypothetical protein
MSLITPLLLIALYIPADFGIAFFMGNFVQTAAREGARIGSGLQKSGEVPDLIFSSSQADVVKTEVLSRLPDYLTNKTVTVRFYTGTACMEFVEVTAEGRYNLFLYRLMRLIGGTAPDFIMISRTTQVRYNYQQYTNIQYCTGSSTYGPYPA